MVNEANLELQDQQAAKADSVGNSACGRKSQVALMLLVGAFVLLIGFVGGVGWHLRASHAVGSDLIVDVSQLDFGLVLADPAFHWPLTLHNAGRRNITVERFITSCGCTRIAPTCVTIPPGEAKEVDLVLDLASSMPQEQFLPIREFSVVIQALVTGNRTLPPKWNVKGQIRNLLATSLQRITLDGRDRLVAGQRSRPVRLDVKMLAPEMSLAASLDLCAIVHRSTN